MCTGLIKKEYIASLRKIQEKILALFLIEIMTYIIPALAYLYVKSYLAMMY
jgi:hypothetical protein